jgi:hypothetical protein
VTENADNTGASLQFDKAEFVAPEGGRTCQRCTRAVGQEYFEAHGQMLCPPCGDELRGGPGGRAAWLRGLLFGGGAALLGTILWYVAIKNDAGYGLIAIGIGLFVGFAVRKGSRGRGGWRYQALAMGLTYLSMTVVYTPAAMKGMLQGAHKADKNQAGKGNGEAGKDEAGPLPSEAPVATARAPGAPSGKPPAGDVSFGKAVAALSLFVIIALVIACVAPFLAGAGGLMNLLIIAIALYEAWKINRRVVVTGPFRTDGAAAAP